jgi:glycosyltransferase involved in cell wall biosynthesis
MNRQQLLSRLGRHLPILYSQGLLYSWDRRSAEFRKAPLRETVEPRDSILVYRPPRYLIRIPRIFALDMLALRVVARRWRSILSARGRKLVAYLFHPAYAEYVRALNPDAVVYHAYDLFSKTPGWTNKLDKAEHRLACQADLVLASSRVTASYLESISHRSVTFFPNGVDYDLFSSALAQESVPDDLISIPRPRFCYAGNLNRKVDLPLIQGLAVRQPGWHFVLVGARGDLDKTTANAYEACQKLPNVHFLGHKQPERLPHYVANCDANLMTYRMDRHLWTAGIYPLKLHEYLASGRPVISADIPSVREFDTVVRIARSVKDWETALSDALDQAGNPFREIRQSVAIQNSWDLRASALEDLLRSLMS